MSEHEQRRRTRLAWALALVALLGGAAGLVAGSEGWSLAAFRTLLADGSADLILWQIRAPRTLGA